MLSRPTLAIVCAATVLLSPGGNHALAQAKPFPPNSPEHQALTAAGPYLEREGFTLRNDYWEGIVSTDLGTAMRLQFFKGNLYRLFFGVDTRFLPKDARLHLQIFDTREREVAAAYVDSGPVAAVTLEFTPRKTGLYLILMRVESPAATAAARGINLPSALFYGWE